MSEPSPAIQSEEIMEDGNTSPEIVAKIDKANVVALEIKERLKEKIQSGVFTEGDLLRIVIDRDSSKVEEEVFKMIDALDDDGRPIKSPLYNLDIPAEWRYNILSLARAGGNYGIEQIKEWVSFPDHRRPEKTGFNFYNNFSSYLTSGFTACIAEQIRVDFRKKYPDLFETIINYSKDTEEDYKAMGAEMRPEVEKLFDQDDKFTKLAILQNEVMERYYTQHPDSPFAKYVNALNNAYSIMRNEYGLLHREITA